MLWLASAAAYGFRLVIGPHPGEALPEPLLESLSHAMVMALTIGLLRYFEKTSGSG